MAALLLTSLFFDSDESHDSDGSYDSDETYDSDESLTDYDSEDDFYDSDSTYSDEELKEEDNEFDLGLFLSLLTIMFTIGAFVFWVTSVREKRFYEDLTFNHTFDYNAWQVTQTKQYEETRHELETIQQASKIAMALEIFKLMPIDQQLQFNKWVPVPSLFKGVDDYLKSINKFQTATHQFMYLAEPKFKINGNATEMVFEWEDFKHRQTFVKGRSDCDNCPKAEWSCKDSILTIKEDTLFVHRKFTRVYYIPTKDLLKLLPSH